MPGFTAAAVVGVGGDLGVDADDGRLVALVFPLLVAFLSDRVIAVGFVLLYLNVDFMTDLSIQFIKELFEKILRVALPVETQVLLKFVYQALFCILLVIY